LSTFAPENIEHFLFSCLLISGFAFPDAVSLEKHNKSFDLAAFHLRSRLFAARERLTERAREACNAVRISYHRVKGKG
jgi:hypothetical protein